MKIYSLMAVNFVSVEFVTPRSIPLDLQQWVPADPIAFFLIGISCIPLENRCDLSISGDKNL